MNRIPAITLLAALGTMLIGCGQGKVVIYNPTELLTTADVESYYGIPFRVAVGSHDPRQLPPGVLYYNGLSYYPSGVGQMQQFKRNVLLDVFQCANQRSAHEHLNRLLASGEKYNIRADDAPGLGDRAWWWADKLLVERHHVLFTLVVVDIFDQTSLADRRAGALAFAKKVDERLK